MPYTKEQLRIYWQTNKVILNQKRREKRRLAKLGLATEEVSHNLPSKVSHLKVNHNQPKAANLNQVSHGKPNLKTANPKLTQLIKEWLTWTNYSCAPGCLADKYCNNCWYFAENELINYKKLNGLSD